MNETEPPLQFKKLLQLESKKRIEFLFDRYGKQLFSYGNRQWKISKDATWDLVYSTIYKIDEVIGEYEYENEQKLQALIFRIFINRIKNHVRDEETRMRGNREVELKEDKLEKIEVQPKKDNKELTTLNQLLDELEDWQRILLLMRAQGFSYGEISNYINKPEKNLKVYYGRLKKQITLKMSQKLEKPQSNEK